MISVICVCIRSVFIPTESYGFAKSRDYGALGKAATFAEHLEGRLSAKNPFAERWALGKG
jgi:hypothetical protein